MLALVLLTLKLLLPSEDDEDNDRLVAAADVLVKAFKLSDYKNTK